MAPFQGLPDAAVIDDGRLGVLVHARFVHTPCAAQQHGGHAEGLSAVVRAAYQQIAIFGGHRKHVQRAAVNEHAAPEAGHELAYIMPCFALVVAAEYERQVLGALAGKHVHAGQQIAVGMAHEAGGAQISAGEFIAFIIGMQIIHHGTDAFWLLRCHCL